MSDYKFHELCEQYPTLPEEELLALGTDLLKNGLQQKIVRYKGEILDGKNRILAGELVHYEFKEADFIDLSPTTMPGSFTISMNLLRRHIEAPAYRIELALKMLEYDKVLAEEPEIEDKHFKKIMERKENDIIAKNAHSDSVSVARARQILERTKEDPKVKQEWERAKTVRNNISIKKIYETHIAPKKKKHRRIKIKTPTKIELRQEVTDLREKLDGLSNSKKELKDLKTREDQYKIAFLKTVEVAQKLGYWAVIKKHLRDIEEIKESPLAIVRKLIREEESPFPTPKQLREAEL